MRYFKVVGGLLLAALLLSRPQAAAAGALRAAAQWYAAVAPAVFPFLALMPLLTCREAGEAGERLLGPALGALFRLPGAAAPAVLVGMAAGSPAGATAVRSAAANAPLNRGQLRRLALAIPGFSPAFLVGGVGAGMLGSAALGWKLLAAQAMTQLALLLVLRNAWRGDVAPVPPTARAAEAQPVRAAVLGVLTICGYMALFGALAAAARDWVGGAAADALLCLMDVPSGAALLAGLPLARALKLPLLAALIGFGGGCVAAQNLGVLKGCGVRPAEYLGLRALAAGLGGGFMALLMRLPAPGEGALPALVKRDPLPVAALAAVLLAVPAIVKLGYSILNNQNGEKSP